MLSHSSVRLLFLLPLALLCQLPTSTPGRDVQIKTLDDRVRVELDGKLFTEYYFSNVPRPFCFPLIGPGGIPITRNFPMALAQDEEKDHPHHRSFWFSHGSVNGIDFWSEVGAFGKIVHDRFTKISSRRDKGIIATKNRWLDHNGLEVCSDETALTFYPPDKTDSRWFDFEITIHASNGPLTFGDTKEGSLALRLAETMRVKGPKAHGHIVNSVGGADQAAWGQRADWCDYYGPVGGIEVGAAIFDHPKNLNHPTWWHVRDYGLFAANPFGRHDFEKLSDKSAGNFTVPAGRSLTLRYRILLHSGNEKQGKVAAAYQDYVKSHQTH